jgi:hypothetical protein
MQSSQANCGPTAMYNALQALGIRRSLSECERLCQTNATDGTYFTCLYEAIDSIRGCNPTYITFKSWIPSILTLREKLRRGRPTILIVDNEEHYVAAIGVLGDRVIIADSALNELVVTYPEKQLQARWKPDFWGLTL